MDESGAGRGARANFYLLAGLAVAGLVILGVGLAWLLEQDILVRLASLNTWLADNVITRLGYGGVFVLMFIESSFVPFPSEVVMPPAGDLARRSAEWSLGWVIATGVAGSLAGALVNYGLARYIGRALLLRFVVRYGSYVRISPAAYFRSEAFFQRHGAMATFIGRLIPGIRQIISLPAGLARMNLLTFSVLTSLGAAIWVAVLAVLGYRFGQDAEALSAALKTHSRWLALGAVVLAGGYVLFRWVRSGAREKQANPGGTADRG